MDFGLGQMWVNYQSHCDPTSWEYQQVNSFGLDENTNPRYCAEQLKRLQIRKAQIDNENSQADREYLNYYGEVSTKRRSSKKRKTLKRRSTKRRSTKRRSPKRRSTKRRSPKRRSAKSMKSGK